MSIFELTDDERVIAETAAAFAAKRLAPHALEWDHSKHFPTDVLRAAAELGMAAIYCGEDVGGSGLRRIDAVRIFEELAAADPALASFISIHNMCAWMVDTYGNPEQRKTWVPRLASMQTIASYCLTEPGAGSDASALRTKAVRDSDGWVLDGVKQFISGAGVSDVYLVMARTGADGPKGISAFLVEKGTPGLSFGPNEAKMGWNTQPTAQVILEQVRVPADALLGISTSGVSLNVNRALRRARDRKLMTIGFTGRDGGTMPALCDFVFVVPSWSVHRVQEVHTVLLHLLWDTVHVAQGEPDVL